MQPEAARKRPASPGEFAAPSVDLPAQNARRDLLSHALRLATELETDGVDLGLDLAPALVDDPGRGHARLGEDFRFQLAGFGPEPLALGRRDLVHALELALVLPEQRSGLFLKLPGLGFSALGVLLSLLEDLEDGVEEKRFQDHD